MSISDECDKFVAFDDKVVAFDDLVEASCLARECWRSSTNCYGDDDDQRDMTIGEDDDIDGENREDLVEASGLASECWRSSTKKGGKTIVHLGSGG